MRKRTHTPGKRVLAAMVCVAALVAAGCGSDKEGKQLPSGSVAQLKSSLDSIQRRVELGDGACRDVTEGGDTDVDAVQNKIDSLPSSVDKDVRDALQQSFDNLFDLVRNECAKTDTETNTTTTETAPPPTETQPTPTETQPTETQPTETQTTPQDNQGKGKGKDKSKGKAGDTGDGGTQAGEG